MKKLILVLTLTMILGQTTSPCDDELYLELKSKKLDELSEREYNYFISKDTQCNQYLSSNTSNQLLTDLKYNSKLNSLQSRKMFDLVGLTTIYGLTVGLTAAIDGGIDKPLILVPGIGPFLLLDEASEDYTLILFLSGALQTAFLIDHNLTMGKINNLSTNLSISSNLNPYSPTVSLSYRF